MNEAYALDDYDKAKALLERHARVMEEQHPRAAASLREGLDETLTVMRLGIGPTLRRSLATTNPIESTFATVRRVSSRVTRWPTGTTALRWALTGYARGSQALAASDGARGPARLIAALRELDLARAALSSSKRAA